MKTGVFYAPHDIRVEDVPDPEIVDPTDALVRVTYSCICGSDLWSYRGISEREKGSPCGHEFMGVVEKVGADVNRIQVGDLVIAPFSWYDGTCPACLDGLTSACWHGGNWGGNGTVGGQGEKVRSPFADATLHVVPKDTSEDLMPGLLTLSDVMCTGHHAAVSAEVGPGKTVVVIGDGAVGLCAVLASKRLGAKRIILLSRNDDRTKVGKQFGATDIVSERGEEGIAKIKEMTEDRGVDSVLECVGTKESWEQAFGMVRFGGKIGYVGVPHDVVLPIEHMFRKNIGVMGGVAPAGAYIDELMVDVLSEKIDPSPVFDLTLPLSDLAKGYEAMDKREAIKVLIKP